MGIAEASKQRAEKIRHLDAHEGHLYVKDSIWSRRTVENRTRDLYKALSV